jgi:hypothetical protein
MTNLFFCRAARILGPVAVLWVAPASAADLAVTACEPVSTEIRSAVSGKKALTTARTSSVLHSSVQRDKAASSQRDRQASSGERNNSEIWYRRQFVLLVGVAY